MTIQRDIERSKRRLNQMLAAPVVHLGEVSTMARLILSVEETMKREPLDETHQAYRDTWEIENVVGDLRAHMTDRNARQILVEELERIERAADDLNVLVGELRERRERQVAKVAQYAEAAE